MKKGLDDPSILFKTIFDQSPVSTQIFTTTGETFMVNKAWEKLWNVKFAQVKAYNVLQDQQLVETGTMPYILRGFKGEIVSIPPIQYDPSRNVEKKGLPVRWLSAKMYPIKNTKGVVTHIVLQHEDITDKMRFDAALKESEKKFRILTSHAPVGIYLTDKQGNCVFVNERWCKLAGMNKTEALGGGWTNALHPDDKNRVFKAWYAFAKSGREFNLEYRFLTPKKKVTWLAGSAVALRDKNKKTTGYMGTIADITGQKLALDSLKNSEERLRLALDAGKIGVWDWNIDENTLTWTDKVYAIHGVKKNSFEVTLKNFQHLIHPDDKKRVLELIEKSLTDRHEFNVEFRIVTPTGDIRWVATRATTSYNAKNEPIRMLGATSDITEQKQLDQERSDFLSMASHELKTPITSMIMFVNLLSKELQTSSLDKPQYFAKRIKDQTQRLTELTNDLLDVSRLETGKLRLHLDHFDLNDLVQDTVESLAETTKHTITFKDGIKIPVYADRYRVYQVLVNLITNAIKYSPQEKTIKIRLSQKDGHAVFSIKDYGIGIAKEKHTKIFDRLYQVTDPTEKTFPGLGLGLYISKEIVERHNGKIWLTSKKGFGSTFYFNLPLAKDSNFI